MTLQNNQVRQLVVIIQAVWDGVIGADEGGLMNSVRESKAAADYLTESRAEFAGNSVVEQIISALTPGGGDDLSAEEQQAAMELALDPNVLMQRVGEIDAMLGGSPEAYGVKVFLYTLAERIAGAAGTARFGGGEKFSAAEQQWLTILRAWLAI